MSENILDFPSELVVGLLSSTHPSYCGVYTKKLEALYRGGSTLMALPTFQDMFPRHRRESDKVYEERRRRAYYIPYAGEIVDHLVASLFQQPLTMERSDDSDFDQYYKDLVDDISPKGGERCSLNSLLKEQTLTAFTKRVAYTLVDLPRSVSVPYRNRVEQEQAGALDAYAVPLANESVIDWEEERNGSFSWVRVADESTPCPSPLGVRDKRLMTWTIYTRNQWARYQLSSDVGAQIATTDKANLVDMGIHTFGAVPIIRMSFPHGLWAMEKLEGLARELLNKVSALSWAQYQSLFPQFYEWLHPQEESMGVTVGNGSPEASKAKDQPRGQGYVQVRDARDKASYVGPDTSAFDHSMRHIEGIRDEMHRVVHQMALTLDNNASALRRSADSKAHDKASKAVILTAIGQIVRDHARDVFDMITTARGDVMQGNWKACGMEEYDATDTSAIITEAVDMSTLEIPSKTHKVLTALKVSKAYHGEDLGEEVFEKIEQELIANIPDESGAPIVDEEVDSMEGVEDGEPDSTTNQQPVDKEA